MLQKLDVQVGPAESSNLPFNLGISSEISGLWSVPYRQEGIRCKVPRSDYLTVGAVRRKGSGPQVLCPLRVGDRRDERPKATVQKLSL